MQRAWSAYDGLPVALKLLIYLFLWPFIELCFVFRVRRYLALRGAQAVEHTVADEEEVARFWRTVIDEGEPGRGGVSALIHDWFVGEGELHADNLLDLICWICYNAPPEVLPVHKEPTKTPRAPSFFLSVSRP